MIVVIPAYEPGARLAPLVAQLRRMAPELDVIVVDDGSGPSYRPVFDAVRVLGAEVLTHERNLGKGAALRTAFRHALSHFPGRAVVTADSDGQHTAHDILRIAERTSATGETESALVLGVRAFGRGTPWRSRLGNAVSSALFAVAAGYRVTDTQTGLRGIPAELVGWAAGIPGERFAFELEMLLACRAAGVRVIELPIETVYLQGNAATHFRPIVDSARVLRPLVGFAAASFAGFLVDSALLFLLTAIGAPLLGAVIGARVVSATVNFAANRRYVFRSRGSLGPQLARYAALAALVLAANYALLAWLTAVGVGLVVAKIVVESALFLTTFAVQRMLVFVGRRRGPASAPRRGALRRPAVAAVAAVSVLGLAGCSVVSESAARSDSSATTVTAESAGSLWDTSTVHEIHIDAADGVLEQLIDTYLETGEKEWAAVTVTIDGTVFEDVGIKLKGNSSLRQVSADTDLADVPWILRLDKLIDGQSYQGETELVVRGNSSETSLNEAVALGLLRASGLAAENATAVRFSVGDGEAALRLVIENPTEEWADEEFESTGQLYKAESGGDEEYHGDDPEAYADSWDQEGGDDDLASLIDFLEFIGESDDATFAAELDEHLDVEAFARYLAFQDLVENTDDIDGPGNNWYLFVDDSTGIATVVNWDLNLAFGQSPGGGAGGGGGGGGGNAQRGQRADTGDGDQADGRPNRGGGGGGSGSSLLKERFLDVPEFAALYEAAAADLNTELIESGVAADLIASWQQALDDGAGDLVSASTVSEEADAIRSALGIS
ncbi:CotH kinase family protein [Homoserinibacter sp. GY 40078]|uniref:CotH kinase family protein n=1 Tax=Homoserinibacter sp. GY 40078 TaxID=2603275 RepID=UPI0011C93EB9|nr:CotH kinase family protein [Homoserinibacter sp. GY 40078]TXK19886.1 glycosyltransferase [Homoserinibacter sp. GY 40078]